MTRYKTRPGVVLTSICGEHILVAAKRLRNVCPYVTNINETSAFLWQRLVGGATVKQLMDAVEAEYELEDEGAALEAVNAFVNQLIELNYLIPDDGGEKYEN